ncbi:coenzyme F420:L-glutamate ligase [Actinocatenispora thailandica]|uniref:Coenzyme F420:L-glutamate ligase n=1 Tax=Actinocatenispora thailandica TaxID=227318 RepID=A0A7R7DTB6_9ACTN|nr:coenzyme F420:L-glutamate ligase [Actinocatenispora thailandica]
MPERATPDATAHQPGATAPGRDEHETGRPASGGDEHRAGVTVPARIEVLPLVGIGEVTPGDDLAALIGKLGADLRDDDILVVTSKIVSKAEGRLVPAPADPEAREAARQRAVTAETVRVVATRGRTRIVQTRHGLVLAAAGVDASNVDTTQLVLLPVDPDASARALRAELAARLGIRVAVVITDTMGRTWRNGQTDVAIGAAGLAPLRDHRGQTDPYGNDLSVTAAAVIDELAAAADLVKGKTSGVPVAVVRGLGPVAADDGPGAAALVRPSAEDMFSLGTAEALAAGRREVLAVRLAAGELSDDPVPDAPVRRAVAVMRGQASEPGLWRYVRVSSPAARRALTDLLPGEIDTDLVTRAPVLLVAFRTEALGAFDLDDEDPETIAAVMRQMDGIACAADALAAEGLVHVMVTPGLIDPPDPVALGAALGVPASWQFLGATAAGYPARPVVPADDDPGDAYLER